MVKTFTVRELRYPRRVEPQQHISICYFQQIDYACGKMGLGTKNRQYQTADSCKQHLREKNPEKLALVEEFIEEFEGSGKNLDLTRWSQFADIKGIKTEMLKRLDSYFDQWLNP
jgi:hypothetical protein